MRNQERERERERKKKERQRKTEKEIHLCVVESKNGPRLAFFKVKN